LNKENIMLSLQSALKHKENWNVDSVYASLLNALLFMNQKDFRRVQLILCVPRYVQTKDSSTMIEQLSEKESMRHEELLLEIYKFIKEYLPLDENKKPVIKIDMFSMSYPVIVNDRWSNTVSVMFNRITENIESLKEEEVHSLYLINSKDFELLNFKDHVPFANCIIY